MARIAACIGGGVIGGGWAARFLLGGWDVNLFDPDPDAPRKVHEVLDNARRSLPGLSDLSPPREGRLQVFERLEDAVRGAAYIQESVPERLALKHDVYRAVQAVCPEQAVLASSTSGFTPSQLQEGAARASQILVAHPFNPVYLLPLVELVPSPQTGAQTVAAARDCLLSTGMWPLHVRAEIDAHIADRLLEAVWREALWLIRDDIATTGEIDDAIRYGFGLRWAQMGLFETYRIAGGEAGMAHFISQFGPCLSWPWTKLMDVPELTGDLVDKIAAQSDAQSGGRSIRELERVRDRNLVALLRALKAQDWGAGALLNQADEARRGGIAAGFDMSGPIQTVARVVPSDWTDYNGHMNEARYLQCFGEATDRMMQHVGCDADYIAAGKSFFTVETHIRHLQEVHAGAEIRVESQVLSAGGKKLRLFHRMYDGARLLATGEHMLIHVSLETRRACVAEPPVLKRLEEIAAGHADLPWPDGAGKAIGQTG